MQQARFHSFFTYDSSCAYIAPLCLLWQIVFADRRKQLTWPCCLVALADLDGCMTELCILNLPIISIWTKLDTAAEGVGKFDAVLGLSSFSSNLWAILIAQGSESWLKVMWQICSSWRTGWDSYFDKHGISDWQGICLVVERLVPCMNLHFDTVGQIVRMYTSMPVLIWWDHMQAPITLCLLYLASHGCYLHMMKMMMSLSDKGPMIVKEPGEPLREVHGLFYD